MNAKRILARICAGVFIGVMALWTTLFLYQMFWQGPPTEFVGVRAETDAVRGSRFVVSAHVKKPVEYKCMGSALYWLLYPDGTVVYSRGDRVKYPSGLLFFVMEIPERAPFGKAVFRAREYYTCGGIRYSETNPIEVTVK